MRRSNEKPRVKGCCFIFASRCTVYSAPSRNIKFYVAHQITLFTIQYSDLPSDVISQHTSRWASETSHILVLKVKGKNVDFNKFSYTGLWGASSRSSLKMAKIAKPFQTQIQFIYLKNNMYWTDHYFWKPVIPNGFW